MDAELSDALATIRSLWRCEPKVGLILGTGLGGLIDAMRVEAEICYGDIPYFPRSTAMAHKGALLCGEMAGVKVLTMAGRCHLYEGYSIAELQFPIRVMHALGLRRLIITNAAGGLNSRYEPGDVMVIEDHVNLMFPGEVGFQPAQNRGQESGGRNQQTHSSGRLEAYPTYCPSLQHAALSTARILNFPCRRGVYVGVKGPNYETRAEYRAFRRLGGDAVGMSTIPEVLAAHALGMQVLGLSSITNVACPDKPKIVTSDEVVEIARLAEPKLRQIILSVLGGVGSQPARNQEPGTRRQESGLSEIKLAMP